MIPRALECGGPELWVIGPPCGKTRYRAPAENHPKHSREQRTVATHEPGQVQQTPGHLIERPHPDRWDRTPKRRSGFTETHFHHQMFQQSVI